MESASLLAGNVQRLQFLKKKTGIDLSVSQLAVVMRRFIFIFILFFALSVNCLKCSPAVGVFDAFFVFFLWCAVPSVRPLHG